MCGGGCGQAGERRNGLCSLLSGGGGGGGGVCVCVCVRVGVCERHSTQTERRSSRTHSYSVCNIAEVWIVVFFEIGADDYRLAIACFCIFEALWQVWGNGLGRYDFV